MQDYSARMPIIESLILASPEPLSPRKISDVLDDITPSQIDKVVEELNIKYRDNDISFRIRKIAGGKCRGVPLLTNPVVALQNRVAGNGAFLK